MAQTINCPLYGHFISRPGNAMTLADQTGTTAAQALASACRWFSAMISLKTFVVGTGTAYPIFALETADDSGFTQNVRRLASDQGLLVEAIGAIPAAVPVQPFYMIGFVPDRASPYWRIKVTLNGTSTCTYDVSVAAAA